MFDVRRSLVYILAPFGRGFIKPLAMRLVGDSSVSILRSDAMTVTAEVHWVGGLQFIARAGDGPAVVMDTTDGGGGASPMELVLMGTAGCTAVDVLSILKKKRMKVTGFRINVSGERGDEFPKPYTDIHIEYVVVGTDLKPEGIQQAIDLSEKKYCGAMASMNARFTHSFRMEAPE
jgi:putative redox protein